MSKSGVFIARNNSTRREAHFVLIWIQTVCWQVMNGERTHIVITTNVTYISVVSCNKIYSVTFHQVVVTTVNPSKWYLQVNHYESSVYFNMYHANQYVKRKKQLYWDVVLKMIYMSVLLLLDRYHCCPTFSPPQL